MNQWLTSALIVPSAAFVVDMLIGLLLSLAVAWYYEHYGQAMVNRHKLAALLPVLTLTTGLVITIVKSSLALSLGLVGALSIVRFRTAIKEPEELLFLFVAIAIGLGVGAEQAGVTVAGVLLLLGTMAVRLVLRHRTQSPNLYLNIMVADEGTALFNRVNACLLDHVDELDFRRLDSRDGTLHLTYFVKCKDPATLNDLVDHLKDTFPVSEVSFLQQEQVLGG